MCVAPFNKFNLCIQAWPTSLSFTLRYYYTLGRGHIVRTTVKKWICCFILKLIELENFSFVWCYYTTGGAIIMENIKMFLNRNQFCFQRYWGDRCTWFFLFLFSGYQSRRVWNSILSIIFTKTTWRIESFFSVKTREVLINRKELFQSICQLLKYWTIFCCSY